MGMVSMDNRPNTSIWGTILSCIEIGLNIYQVVALNGEGLMVKADDAEETLGRALFQGKGKDGYIHFEKDSVGEQAAAYELINKNLITDPEALEEYGTPEEIEADGRFLNPEYFGGLPEPEKTPWGELTEKTPVDNGVFFLSAGGRTGLAVHQTAAEFAMSDYASREYNEQEGEYRFYDLDNGAAVAIFELSATRSAVLDLITSWESLMHTLTTQFPAYTDFWNHETESDYLIYDAPAPVNLFLQRQLDRAAEESAQDPDSEELSLPDALDAPDDEEPEM